METNDSELQPFYARLEHCKQEVRSKTNYMMTTILRLILSVYSQVERLR